MQIFSGRKYQSPEKVKLHLDLDDSHESPLAQLSKETDPKSKLHIYQMHDKLFLVDKEFHSARYDRATTRHSNRK